MHRSASPSPGEIHVRLIELRQAAAAERALRCFLSPDEIERAGRFHFDIDRSRFIVTRGWLRVVLAGALSSAPEQLEFSYGPAGKPALAGGYRGAPVAFNVSHSRDYALIGVSAAGALGVDIEQLRPMPDLVDIARSYFSVAETRAILSLSDADRPRAFFRCWTRKEAFMKATGEGMGIALDAFSVNIDEGATTTIAPSERLRAGVDAWTVRGLSLTPACEAAVAVSDPYARISTWLDDVAL